MVFSSVSRYGQPPMAVAQKGGIFTTYLLAGESEEATALRILNRELIQALGLVRGVSHAEFIRARGDGHFYFLECAARVGGAYISEMVEIATGINLWREWARIEIAGGKEPYQLPAVRSDYAGLILSLRPAGKSRHLGLQRSRDRLTPQTTSSCRPGSPLGRSRPDSGLTGELQPPFRRRIPGHRTARQQAGRVSQSRSLHFRFGISARRLSRPSKDRDARMTD